MIRLSLLLLLLPLCVLSSAAHAQSTRLNHCTDAQGQSVYTDRPCDSVGARSRRPPPSPTGNTAARDTLGARCPRRLSELVDALRNGILSNDVNRLSSLYLWGSVSDAGAQRILGQLESLARRPLVDVVPVYPRQDQVAVPEEGQSPAAQGPTLSRRPCGIRSACAWSRRCRAAWRALRRCLGCGGSMGVSGSRCDREGQSPAQDLTPHAGSLRPQPANGGDALPAMATRFGDVTAAHAAQRIDRQ